MNQLALFGDSPRASDGPVMPPGVHAPGLAGGARCEAPEEGGQAVPRHTSHGHPECPACGASWRPGNCHCGGNTGCHRTFGGDRAFTRHRVGYRCTDPETLTFMTYRHGKWHDTRTRP